MINYLTHWKETLLWTETLLMTADKQKDVNVKVNK